MSARLIVLWLTCRTHLLPGADICFLRNNNCLQQKNSNVTVWQTSLLNPYSIYLEIKSRLKLGNACYHLEQNVFSSSSLYKNMMIKIYRTIIFPLLLFCCETCSFTLRMEKRLRFFENRMLRKIFGAEREEVNRE